MRQLAYLFPAFPVFHQTFVLWEVLGLRRNGVSPRIYAMRRGTGKQQPEGESLIAEVTYLPRLRSKAVWRANWRCLRRSPRRYVRLYRAVWQAWRTGAMKSVRSPGWERRPVSLYDRLRGWFNRDPYLYLLKSFLLVPRAVHLADRLARDGVGHLHVHWATYPATVAYIVREISGLPFSVSAHAYDIYMIPRMLPAKVSAARFVVTCARTNAEFLRSLMGDNNGGNIFVNYHGVDVARFAPRTREEAAGPLTIVSCGQLERYKGMHVLIEACATLRRRGVDLRCVIVGEGTQRPRLARQIDSLGLAAHVQLAGSLPHADVAALLQRADVFALASELGGKSGRRDVIANVIVEAMAAGLPVVASAIPGVEELVSDGSTGYLVPPNRSEALADAVERLASSAEVRAQLGRAARERVLRDFDSSKNVRVLADLLRQQVTTSPAPTSVERRTAPSFPATVME